jgi:multisubunit Na+/H+ antiporter MnhE subunit
VRAVAEVLIWWMVLVLVWLGTLNAFSYEELTAAALLAVPCAIAARLGRRAAGVRWSTRAHWVRWLGHLPWGVVRDTIAVLALALRPSTKDKDFDTVTLANDATKAQQAGHEALATAVVSATPGSVVVDAHDGRLVVHTVPIHETGLRRAVASQERRPHKRAVLTNESTHENPAHAKERSSRKKPAPTTNESTHENPAHAKERRSRKKRAPITNESSAR